MITGPDDIVVYLQPVIQLNGVTIKEQSKQKELNEVVDAYRSKGLYFDGRPPLMLFSPFGGSPITGFKELFSKDAANERRFIAFSKTEMETIQINRRYTKQLVKRVTALADSDVVLFMEHYTPSYNDIMQWTDYELVSQIKKKLEDFKIGMGIN